MPDEKIGKREQLFAEVCGAKKNASVKQIRGLMEAWNFTVKEGASGDIVIFRHRVFAVQCTAAIPHRRGEPVKTPYVVYCLRAIEEVQTLEAETDA